MKYHPSSGTTPRTFFRDASLRLSFEVGSYAH